MKREVAIIGFPGTGSIDNSKFGVGSLEFGDKILRTPNS